VCIPNTLYVSLLGLMWWYFGNKLKLLLSNTSPNTFCQSSPTSHKIRTGSRVMLTVYHPSDIKNLNISECVKFLFIVLNL
jgi:hypothetical protein